MFYQQMPIQPNFSYFAMPSPSSVNIAILQSNCPFNLALALALEKSVKNYSVALGDNQIGTKVKETCKSS
jgi:hypothetical protein